MDALDNEVKVGRSDTPSTTLVSNRRVGSSKWPEVQGGCPNAGNPFWTATIRSPVSCGEAMSPLAFDALCRSGAAFR